jgi:hypothetical protein
MYQARKVNGQIHTCTKPGKSTVRYIHVPSQAIHWISWLGTCMYLTVDLPGLVHVCIWPLTFLAWYMYVTDRWLSWLSTYIYLTVYFPVLVHVCIWLLTFLAWYMYVSDCWLSWLGTCMYLTVDFPVLVHVCIWPLTFLAWYMSSYMY